MKLISIIAEGFQLLHAAHTVESFLYSLVRRKCKIQIAFFDEHEDLCVPQFRNGDDLRPKYLLARAAILRYLERSLAQHPSGICVQRFSSYLQPEFLDYIHSNGIYFVLCHDGQSPGAVSTEELENLDQKPDASNQPLRPDDESDTSRQIVSLWNSGNVRKARLAFRYMIFWFLTRAYNVALIDGLEFLDTKVMTIVLEGSRAETSTILNSFHPSPKLVLSRSTGYVSEDMSNLFLPRTHHLHTSSEREMITVVVLSDLMRTDCITPNQLSTFILHTASLPFLPLSTRRLDIPQAESDSQGIMIKFANRALKFFKNAVFKQLLDESSLTCDLADLIDGMLLSALYQSTLDQTTLLATTQVRTRYDTLIAAVFRILPNAFKILKSGTLSKTENRPSASQKRHGQKQLPDSVLPFNNPIFDVHLKPIHLNIVKSPELDTNSAASKVFRELSHWHSHKRAIIQKGPPPKLGWFALRRNQTFMAEMCHYAASLTNAAGKVLEPEVILIGGFEKTGNHKPAIIPHGNEKAHEALSGKVAKAGKKSETKNKRCGRTAALEAAAALQASKLETKANVTINFWKKTCRDLGNETDPEEQYVKVRRYLNNLSKADLAILGPEVELFKVKILVEKWIGLCKSKEKEYGLHIVALIWDAFLRLSKVKEGITKSIISQIQHISKALGLPSINLPNISHDRPLAFTLPTLLRAKRNGTKTDTITIDDISVPMSAQRFQLEFCGPYFERSIDSAPDPRVPFEPDGWQREVLNAIDAQKSLFVVAPTSAGKTFISFYAMKKILEANDDDVVVYVAPTKALVNQIAAEIHARFSKAFKHPGRSVWAIHTRDYRINNPTGCQVLVTVPHILQIMLLAPSHAEKRSSWSYRIKRIIFDEVHCIGQAEDGLVWEQLLLLAPCPIIALSATVGNPDEFSEWLTSTQKAIGIGLVTVRHPHRYSDLRKFVFTPANKFSFKGLPPQPKIPTPGLDGSSAFVFMHPVASLVNKSRGMPDDLNLEARDCLSLYNAMEKYQTEKYPLEAALDPAKALPEVIRKSDILEWEQKLKAVLRHWMSHNDSPFENVRRDLSPAIDGVDQNRVLTPVDSQHFGSSHEFSVNGCRIEYDDLKATTLQLLVELHRKDALPAILFNYDRSMCEVLAQTVIYRLKSSEDAWKESDLGWKKTVTDWEKWKNMQMKAEKKTLKFSKKNKMTQHDDNIKQSKIERVREEASTEGNRWEHFHPSAPIDGFHFADMKKTSSSELKDFQQELRKRSVPQWLISALGRGIGVHHAGMNRKYRQIVEMLFRRGFLRVVIATGTLALGINMPCKTVVFSGDSVFLTALNFRQAAGRAGRRGFDLLGNVVFHGIPSTKVCRLLSSRLPDLNGHFPITTTLVLRLFILLHESKNSDFAVRSIKSLLSQPRLYLGGAESKATVLHHLRFSIEYLRRQYLLDTDGTPLNFAGCVSHLYYTENSSWAFHALLKDGFFHKLCADIDDNPKLVCLTLMLVMAHLFGRRPCNQMDPEFVEKVVRGSSSIVFLPRLPNEAEVILRKHNQDTLDIFRTYVKTFVEQHIHEPDNRLPLTGVEFGGGTDPADELDIPLSSSMEPTIIRSPFFALSGHGDEFESISDLCSSTRSGVFLEQSVIPHLPLSRREAGAPLNAYLYDFFKNGDVTALQKANGIRKGDLWFLLNDFSLVLATINTSLTNFMKFSAGSDTDMIDVMGGGDAFEEEQLDKSIRERKTEENDGEGPETPSEASPPAWETDGGKGLLHVLKAFRALADEFNEKFKSMWA